MKDLAILFLGVLGGIWANALSKEQGISEFIAVGRRKDILQKAFFQSAALSNWIFGKSLFSVQAIAISIAWSLISFTVCGVIGIYTSRGGAEFLVSVPKPTLAASATMVIILLCMEYAYVSKTRFILHLIVKDYEKSWRIFGFFILDLMTTYWMLIVGLPLLIVLFVYCEQIYRIDIDMTKTFFEMPVLEGGSVENRELLFDISDPLGYLMMIIVLVRSFFDEFRAHFSMLDFIQIGAIVRGDPNATNQKVLGLAIIPLTTLAASSSTTTIWVSVTWILAIITLTFYKSMYALGTFVSFVSRPRVIAVGLTTIAWMVVVYLIATLLGG